MLEKYCSMCSENKPVDQFFKNKARSDGVAVYCKLCTKEYARKNNKRVNAYNRKWRADHVDQIKSHDKQRSNDPKRIALQKLYQRKHRCKPEVTQKISARLRNKRRENPEKSREIDRIHYAKYYRGKPGFIEKCKLKYQKHYSQNKEYYTIKSHHRYARKMNAEGSHSVKEWNYLKVQFDYRCARCLERLNLSRDHIVPLSKGGSDYIENIQPLCKSCNSSKHTNTKDYRPIARVAIAYMRLSQILHSSPTIR